MAKSKKAASKTPAAKVVTPPAPPVSVDKSRAAFMIHAEIDSYAQPSAERMERFSQDPDKIGEVMLKPQRPHEMADVLLTYLRTAAQNAHHMGGTEIRIKLRRKWYTNPDSARD